MEQIAKAVDQNLLDHQRLESLINSMADGVLAVDEQGVIVLSNGSALNILDVNSSLIGKRIEEVAKIIDHDDHEFDIANAILSTKTAYTNRDMRLLYADGSMINLYISIAPVHLGYGKKGERGFVMLMRDITNEKSLEEERDEFISVVSHELRTPIAIAEGNVSNAKLIAERQHTPPEILKILNATHDQIIFLGSIINDLATLSRAERSKINLEIEEVGVSELLNDLLHDYSNEASAKGLEFKLEVQGKIGVLKTSRLYLHEILQNFITNAIKYTENGSVTVFATQKPDGVVFEVRDTGIGISKSDQEKVFDKFFRSENWRTRKHIGTGLGLYVTMKLARLIDAEIDLTSELNQGSSFKITVPNLQPKIND